MDKIINYNINSAEKLKWDPSWFGCSDFDSQLVDAIVEFQYDHGLNADGMCGTGTFRVKFAERSEDLEDEDKDKTYSDYIVCSGNAVSIDWKKVVLWRDQGGLSLEPGDYKSQAEPRDIKKFIVHWDVCKTSRQCYKALKNRNLSVHFLIDNDGTIYQLGDTNNICWHASPVNYESVGVEISNAWYLKYQDWYVEKGFGERPIVEESIVRGRRVEKALGFYPEQISALKALTKALHEGLGIPLETPRNITGSEYTDTLTKPATKSFTGVLHHYHVASNKIDCAGLNLVDLIEEIKNGN